MKSLFSSKYNYFCMPQMNTFSVSVHACMNASISAKLSSIECPIVGKRKLFSKCIAGEEVNRHRYSIWIKALDLLTYVWPIVCKILSKIYNIVLWIDVFV